MLMDIPTTMWSHGVRDQVLCDDLAVRNAQRPLCADEILLSQGKYLASDQTCITRP